MHRASLFVLQLFWESLKSKMWWLCGGGCSKDVRAKSLRRHPAGELKVKNIF
jgi:hypothetical protein